MNEPRRVAAVAERVLRLRARQHEREQLHLNEEEAIIIGVKGVLSVVHMIRKAVHRRISLYVSSNQLNESPPQLIC